MKVSAPFEDRPKYKSVDDIALNINGQRFEH